MSIFPKRALQGTSVTIHWNFNTAHITDAHVYPFVRIGVQAPDESVRMLFEDYILALPAIEQHEHAESTQLLHLNKNTPLLVLADYLSTHHKREALVNILKNIQSGRHYYFIYRVAPDAPPGKYKLISEVYNCGEIKYSKTAPDDIFFIEKITFDGNEITNHSTENTPVKIIHYQKGGTLTGENVRVFEMLPKEIIPTNKFPPGSFLLYNEERVIIPLQQKNTVRCIRNQRGLQLEKDQQLHVMLDNNETYTLHQEAKTIWEMADGIITKKELCHTGNEHLYQEMVLNQLIVELK